MMLMLNDSRPMSMDELRAFLGSSEALAFSGQDRVQTYAAPATSPARAPRRACSVSTCSS